MTKKAGIFTIASMAIFTNAASAGTLVGHEDKGIMTLGIAEKAGKERDTRLSFPAVATLRTTETSFNLSRKKDLPICRITGKPFTP